jgi:D-amino-acid dehydrogenase
VVVVDRQPGPALETSFANGGQISVNHATPWAAPGTPVKALKWLGRDDAPLLFHPRMDRRLATWLLHFLRNCTRARAARNTERAVRLALYSREQLKRLRAELALPYDHLALGILHIFRNPKDYAEALPQVEAMARFGCPRRIVSSAECIELEPALGGQRERLVGGIFSPEDESGDAYLFTRRLAEVCAAQGVEFRYGTPILGLRRRGASIMSVEVVAPPIAADAFVVALGSETPLLLEPLGLRLPVYPAKGYSVTIPLDRGAQAPTVSLIDDEFKMVYSRLGGRLRVAGTAEFAGYDRTVRDPRARFLLAKALELFPRLSQAPRAEFWAGLRPSTPDGVPVLGRTRLGNLFLNTGHGTLGWTMACGSGRAVADLVLGRAPEVDLDGLELSRFGH